MNKIVWGVAVASLSVWASLALSGCGTDCTEMGCSDSLMLEFPEPGLEAGVWTFDITADEEKLNCTLEVPIQPEKPPVCTASGIGFVARVDGSDQPAIIGMQLEYRAPKKVFVQVKNQGIPVFEMEQKPRYKKSYPNGPECDPGCSKGTLRLQWDAT